mgnify:CR=1 FL=1
MTAREPADLVFCIFSFNRGRFLRNCVASVERCAPGARIVVVDDDSTDQDTRTALDAIGLTHEVLVPKHLSRHHLGGLYGNMQSALEHCADAPLLCFLQDDTQLVRPVQAQDVAFFEAAFDGNPRLAFLHPCFVKGLHRASGARYTFDERRGLYERAPTERSAGRYFSAMLITRPSRLLARGWRFRRGEPDNNQQARELFDPIGYLPAPIAMWLPAVPSYRGKRKTLGLRLAERWGRCGFYPFRILDEAEVGALRARPTAEPPYAEAHLECLPSTPPAPWTYGPLAGRRLLKALNNLETNLRRVIG